MNVIQINTTTKEVLTLCYDVKEVPTVTDSIKITQKMFPIIEIPIGKNIKYFYDEVKDEFTYEFVDRPLTQDEIVQENLNNLGQQLAQEKLAGIQKSNIIDGLGQQVANLKLQVIQLQGGTN
jgi:hypothetical protein